MKLMSLRCPNCNGPVKQTGEGKFFCESCSTSFLMDYDKEDVEYEKLKMNADLRRRQMEGSRRGSGSDPRKVRTAVIITVAIVLMLMSISIVSSIIHFSLMARSAYVGQQEQEARKQEREKERREEEQRKKEEEERRKKAEEEERQAILDSYKLTPEEILSDEFFVENANSAMAGQLWGNTNLYYTNWVWTEQPEYLTSFFLLAKDDDNREHNILVNIYRVHWDKEYDDRVEKYVMYDCACLYNISRESDGSIKSDFTPHKFTYNSEIIANQFLSGFSDKDQLIRQEIFGRSDYKYTELMLSE